uniref:Uncharacterized protein n=1 Tax=Arundo donax TaxID=35708 RepID=A0A0A9AX08_ARUDO
MILLLVAFVSLVMLLLLRLVPISIHPPQHHH